MPSQQSKASTSLLSHEDKASSNNNPSFGSIPQSASENEEPKEGSATNNNDSPVSENTPFEFLDVHEKSGEASDVELFSDLTVVVSIHMLSDLLTDGDEVGDLNFSVDVDGASANARVWCWFILRVFYIYALWVQYMEVANLHNLYSTTTQRADVIFYSIIFGFMAILVVISKACEKDHHRHVAYVYLFGRLLGLAVIIAQSYSPYAAVSMDTAQYQFLRKYTAIMPKYFLWECAPLILALCFSGYYDNGNDENDDSLILWGGLTMVALRLIIRTIIGWKCDSSNLYDEWDGKLSNTAHTQERYKLITLIFLGELCFSSTSVPGNYYLSLSALVTAMGCFLIYFLARVEGRVEPWNRSALCNLQCHTTHFVIFCLVPIMGVGYVEIMKENNEDDDNDYDEDLVDYIEKRWYHYPHAILSISAGLFLFSIGHLEMMTKDPEQPVQLKRRLRVLMYLTMGLVLAGIQFLSEDAATYVPIVIVGTGLVLIWGVQKSV
eukprot:CAMPEP_0183738816 /NCGR_PEP_ID=MMETSP0737-20130205/55544_1 /TAXON_ID=385413 /ORGANISM="Thalassiosira miniscula, Strain CCMP1093" /LENGTH=493 /DNA_ID=CAMNT_0025973451 /DNA_START=159 /DNA_END=1640 /DNA_ORIENTATION=+